VEDLPAVVVEGPKAVGKTATSKRLANSVIDLARPEEWELTSANPSRICATPPPVLIDEWQLLPSAWNEVRRAVDSGAKPGSFILAGSASVGTSASSAAPTRPAQAPQLHSGAGRMVRLRMRPMALSERSLTPPTVSLADLLSGRSAQVTGHSPLALAEYAEEIAATGFPGIRLATKRSRTDLLDGYLAAVVEHEFPEAGHAVRRPATLARWLRAYAAATATAAPYTKILNAATPGIDNKPARATVTAYRDVLERLWLLDELPAWPGHSALGALARTPRHHLADPGLAARLLGVSAESLLTIPNPDQPVQPRHGTLFGALFESLATLCVRVYAQANRAKVFYLRTENGKHEVDLIVEREDGRILGLDVKLAAALGKTDSKHLLWLRRKVPADVLDLAVLTTGQEAYRRADGVAVIPLALLGP
jgi:predicted AAA+ superfamily ATPase